MAVICYSFVAFWWFILLRELIHGDPAKGGHASRASRISPRGVSMLIVPLWRSILTGSNPKIGSSALCIDTPFAPSVGEG